MMNTQQLLEPVGNALTHVPPVGSLLKWTGALGRLGRRRRSFTGRFGLLGGGILLTAAGVLLFTTKRGRALRAQWGEQVEALLNGQGDHFQDELGGGQDIEAAQIARETRRLASATAI